MLTISLNLDFSAGSLCFSRAGEIKKPERKPNTLLRNSQGILPLLVCVL